MIRPIKFGNLMLACALLSGCASGYNPAPQELSGVNSSGSAISVSQMLTRARGDNPVASESRSPPQQLLLHFSHNNTDLNAQQQNQLHRLANQSDPDLQQPGLLQISCAPSTDLNRYLAASIAITRCMSVSSFLEKRARETRIILQPSLPGNQIRITE